MSYELGDLKILENEMYMLASDTTALATEENDLDNDESDSEVENESTEQSKIVGNMSQLFGPSVDTVWKKRTKQQRKTQSKLIKKVPAVTKLLEEAQNNYIKGDFNLALELLDNAIRLDPNKVDLYSIRAIIYEELNEFKLALNSYLIMAQMCPDNIEVIKKISYLAFNLEDYYNAKVAISRILILEHKHCSFETLNMHCICELNLGCVAEAERLYSIFVSSFPEELSFVVEFALALETFGYKKRALKYYFSYAVSFIGNINVKDTKLQQFLEENIFIVNAPDDSNEDERFSNLFFAISKIIEYLLLHRLDDSNIVALDILNRCFQYKNRNATDAISTPIDIQLMYAVTLIRSIDTSNKEIGLRIIQTMLNLLTESTHVSQSANHILNTREPEVADFDQLLLSIINNSDRVYMREENVEPLSISISILKCQLLAVDELLILKRTTLGVRILNQVVNKLEAVDKVYIDSNSKDELTNIADLWNYSCKIFENIGKYSKALFCSLKSILFDITNVTYVSRTLSLLEKNGDKYHVEKGDILRAHFSQLLKGIQPDKIRKGIGIKLLPSIFKDEVKFFFEMLSSIQIVDHVYYIFAIALCHSLTTKTKCHVPICEDEELAIDYVQSRVLPGNEYSGLLHFLCILNHFVDIIAAEHNNVVQVLTNLCQDSFHSYFLKRKDDIEVIDKIFQMLSFPESFSSMLHKHYPHLVVLKPVESQISVPVDVQVGEGCPDKAESTRMRKSVVMPTSVSDQPNQIDIGTNNNFQEHKKRRSKGSIATQQAPPVTIQSINQLIRQNTPKALDGVTILKEISNNNKFLKNLIEAHEQAHHRRYGESLDLYLEALILQPDQPLISLCLASYLTFMCNHPLVRRRHETLLKAISCLSFYAKSRVVPVINYSKNKITSTALLQEVYYNIARVFHEIRLHHIAVNYYKLALKLADENESIQHLNVTFDAAHNLVLIFRKSGSMGEAYNVMNKYLSF